MVQTTKRSALSGALAGLVCGLFGGGGGMVLLPLWTRWVKAEDRTAFAGALCVTLPLSLVSLGVYAMQGTLDWGAALPYCLGGLPGGLIGGASLVPDRFLAIIQAANSQP